MKKVYIIIAALALASCSSGMDELEGRISGDESKISGMESDLSALGTEVDAVKRLLAGHTVMAVSKSGGRYELALDGGGTMTLSQGTAGETVVPTVGVDGDGWWMADYGNGMQFILDASGAKVNAVGMAVVTPVFSADASGFWTVSLDGGNSFIAVKDASGAPVKAASAGTVTSSIFKDISFGGGYMDITFRDGQTLSVPVAGALVCSTGTTGVQSFSAGQTRSFAVVVEGAASHFTACPDEWKAARDGSSLKITAPAAGGAASGTVSLVAVAGSGLAAVAGIEVSLN
jgi:hypothetical protein